MKQFIRNIEESVTLFRDDKSGIAWIEDGRTGLGYSYIVDVRKNGEPNNAERKIYTYKEFRQHFASKTALPN